jgi:hypothetical protein
VLVYGRLLLGGAIFVEGEVRGVVTHVFVERLDIGAVFDEALIRAPVEPLALIDEIAVAVRCEPHIREAIPRLLGGDGRFIDAVGHVFGVHIDVAGSLPLVQVLGDPISPLFLPLRRTASVSSSHRSSPVGRKPLKYSAITVPFN